MKLSAIFALATLAACHTPAPSPTPPPDVITDIDGAVDPEDADAARLDDCATACAVVRKLGCADGAPVDGGQSCSVVCRHARDTHLTDLHQGCVAKAHSLAEVKACGGAWCK